MLVVCDAGGFPGRHTIALAALLGVTGILVHSLVDFNLQVQTDRCVVLCCLHDCCNGTSLRLVRPPLRS
jgi:hypothetical protein